MHFNCVVLLGREKHGRDKIRFWKVVLTRYFKKLTRLLTHGKFKISFKLFDEKE